MRRPHAAAMLAAALALLPLAGCSHSDGSTPVATVPVKGTVTYKGKPLTAGQIKFEPEGVGRGAFGEIGPDGTFTLTTFASDDGAVPGSHRVAVTGAGKALPKKFSGFASSGVEIEVVPDKADYPIDLE